MTGTLLFHRRPPWAPASSPAFSRESTVCPTSVCEVQNLRLVFSPHPLGILASPLPCCASGPSQGRVATRSRGVSLPPSRLTPCGAGAAPGGSCSASEFQQPGLGAIAHAVRPHPPLARLLAHLGSCPLGSGSRRSAPTQCQQLFSRTPRPRKEVVSPAGLPKPSLTVQPCGLHQLLLSWWTARGLGTPLLHTWRCSALLTGGGGRGAWRRGSPLCTWLLSCLVTSWFREPGRSLPVPQLPHLGGGREDIPH